MILDKTLISILNIKNHLILCPSAWWKARLKLTVIALHKHKDGHSNRYSRLFLEFQYIWKITHDYIIKFRSYIKHIKCIRNL